MATIPIELVLTAARERQAEGYRAALIERERRGDLPPGLRWRVLADPQGRRVGSGAATALALASLAGTPRTGDAGAAFRGRRTVIIHSGGDSRRLPAFAAIGKAFAPLPGTLRSGAPTTVFDLVLADLLALPTNDEGEVIVASGDAVVGAARLPAGLAGDMAAALDGARVLGLAELGTAGRAARHGVFVLAKGGGAVHPVAGFLQKPSLARLRAEGAIGADGSALIDTGIVRWTPSAAAALVAGFGLADRRRRSGGAGNGLLAAAVAGEVGSGGVDLYRHVLLALVPSVDRDAYLAALAAERPGRARRGLLALRERLADCSFAASVLPGRRRAEGFLHAGTTREYLSILFDPTQARRHGLERPAGRVRELETDRCTVTRSGGDAALVQCRAVRAELGGDNLVVGVPQRTDLRLPRGIGSVTLPIGRGGWSTVLFHADDDGKTPILAGGLFLGRRWSRAELAERFGIRAIAADATWWDLPLWTVGARMAIPTWLLRSGRGPAAWRRAKRRSFGELLDAVNHHRQAAFEASLVGARLARAPLEALRGDDRLSAERLAAAIPAARRASVARRLVDAVRDASPLERARALAVAARLSAVGRAACRQRSRDAVREAVEADGLGRSVRGGAGRQMTAAIRIEQRVWASAPARIDLAGGWSDTPPICHERGGTVANLAVELDGRPPVHAIAALLPRHEIVLHSVDLGLTRVIRSTAELLDRGDPGDWTALARAALRAVGVAPAAHRSLPSFLQRFGGGLSVSTLAAVPKGSGLGTSSILAATLVTCLGAVVGRSYRDAELIAATSLVEQWIGSCGGWQDQVGGAFGGFKIARTDPGDMQRPSVSRIEPPTGFVRALEGRAVLCFTGRRRMARDILERVVDRYLCRDGDVLDVVTELKSGAERLAEAVRRGDLGLFAAELAEYWRLKRRIDPASSTAEIESMVAPLLPWLDAWELPGAGGGGFLFLLGRSEVDAERIRDRLTRHPPNPQARVVAWRVASAGLSVASL